MTYRIDGLMPTDANGVLAAQYKAGKSTAVGNLTRSLADGLSFPGGFDTTRAERFVLIDNEFDERMLRRCTRDYGITNPTRVRLLPLRGKTGAVRHPRSRCAGAMGGADRPDRCADLRLPAAGPGCVGSLRTRTRGASSSRSMH